MKHISISRRGVLAWRVVVAMAALIIGCPYASKGQSDTVLISWQGLVTDSDGQPVAEGWYSFGWDYYSDSISLDPLGSWESDSVYVGPNGQAAIHVAFSANYFGIWDGYWNTDALWFEITFNGEVLSPRTRLASVPHSAAANRVIGDIRTAPGKVVIKSPTSDSAVVLMADGDTHVIQLHPPDPCDPPEACGPAFEVIADAESHSMELYGPGDSLATFAVSTNPESTSMRLEMAKVLPIAHCLGIVGAVNLGAERATLTIGSDPVDDYPRVEMSTDAVADNALLGLSVLGGQSAVEIVTDEFLAELKLLNGDPAGPPDVVVQATVDGGGQIGVNTDAPAEALDVNGTTQTTGFKMPTGAADGHVLTSDGDGNGTWQVTASGSRCGESGEFDGVVNSDMIELGGLTTIDFASPFTSVEKPHMYLVIVLKAAADGLVEGAAIKAVEDVKGSAGNWTGFDIAVSKYSGGSISDLTNVYVTWMAIRP
ncbi:MAG: hypothetical protein JSU65_02105 [Candidatus Zixiibacteriota bacterium]|nr:MAG: hypothetical protein JSU65_02105 [candidate division Zixibacteria bacterium]